MLPGNVVGIVEVDAVQAQLYPAMLAAAGIRAQIFATEYEFHRRSRAETIDTLLRDWITSIDVAVNSISIRNTSCSS